MGHGIVEIEFDKKLHAGVGQSIDQLCKQLQPKNNQDFQTNDIVAFVQEWIKQYYIFAQLQNPNSEESPNTNLSFDFYFQEGDRGITEGKLRRASRLLNPNREEGQPDLVEKKRQSVLENNGSSTLQMINRYSILNLQKFGL